MSPETQNWCTVTSASMFGEMYVLTARLAIAAITGSAPTRYPTRTPGQTVLVNEPAATTTGAGRVVQAQHRRQRLAAEPDVDVRVVLEDREAVLPGQLEQRAAGARATG